VRTMNARAIKKMLGSAAVVVSTSAVALLVWGFTTAVRIDAHKPDIGRYAPKATTMPAGSSDPAIGRQAGLSLTELQSICAIDLHRPLYDAPKPEARKVATPARAVALTVRLIGTAAEPGHSVAILQKNDGSIELCAQGRSIDHPGGAITVTKVEHRKATLRCGGRTYVLEIKGDK